ncbi:hypothetical protein DASC09_034480 [Saccharomycopsis crataegensis]|uniref:Uncharacterized protein n=1 Tax=Saccharomycopsis crataegensis TaxID=43959 RepID=A0AAV5QMN1_9ASCO|nr:hypothetical protein DASC09_034480 [Saccharomycopsis crataegensis]
MEQSIYSSPSHQYHIPLHQHYPPCDQGASYMMMISPEKHSPFTSPARPNYIINNPSVRSKTPYQATQSNQLNNYMRFGIPMSDTRTHFRSTGAAYEEKLTNNSGLVYSEYVGTSCVEQNTEKRVFPDAFNPRQDPNMSHKEKVPIWIDNIPSIINDNNWTSSCYPAILEDDIDDIDCPLAPTSEEISEAQARRVTLLSIKVYLEETNERIITPDLQEKAKKILSESGNFQQYDDSMNDQLTFADDYNIENKSTRIQSTPRKRKSRKR